MKPTEAKDNNYISLGPRTTWASTIRENRRILRIAATHACHSLLPDIWSRMQCCPFRRSTMFPWHLLSRTTVVHLVHVEWSLHLSIPIRFAPSLFHSNIFASKNYKFHSFLLAALVFFPCPLLFSILPSSLSPSFSVFKEVCLFGLPFPSFPSVFPLSLSHFYSFPCPFLSLSFFVIGFIFFIFLVHLLLNFLLTFFSFSPRISHIFLANFNCFHFCHNFPIFLTFIFNFTPSLSLPLFFSSFVFFYSVIF